MIDVGGAALLGAAARNAAGVAAVSSPAHYQQVVAEIRERGLVSAELRARLVAEAYGTVAAYYAEIAAYLNQISGNTSYGVLVPAAGITGTSIRGNLIGLTANGFSPLPNSFGIGLAGGATDTAIGGTNERLPVAISRTS